MKPGTRFKHTKGGIYRLLGFCKIKNDTTREWEEAVIYVSEPINKPGENPLYVRSTTDFNRRFEEIRS